MFRNGKGDHQRDAMFWWITRNLNKIAHNIVSKASFSCIEETSYNFSNCSLTLAFFLRGKKRLKYKLENVG